MNDQVSRSLERAHDPLTIIVVIHLSEKLRDGVYRWGHVHDVVRNSGMLSSTSDSIRALVVFTGSYSVRLDYGYDSGD